MNARDPGGLLPHVRSKYVAWLAACEVRGVVVLGYCFRRTPEEQAALYAQGRTAPGAIVTKAKPWKSAHQYGRAWDAVPLLHGKPDWSYSDLDRDETPDEPWWRVMVEEADRLGIEWAGRWTGFREYVHWQILDGHTIEELYELEGPGMQV